MSPSDTFESGKEYRVTVSLIKTDDPFFADVTGTLNGKTAEIKKYNGGTANIGVSRVFTCKSSAILGDVDGDDKVDIFDVSSIQKSIAGVSGYVRYDTLDSSDPKLRVADVDGDGKVDIFDAALIQKWMAGSAAAQTYGIGQPMS